MTTLWRGGGDAHLHFHAERIRRGSDKGAVQRQFLDRIPHHRDGDKAGFEDTAAGRIEIELARAQQIDLRPYMVAP